MKSLFTLTLCLASLAFGSQALAAKVYKWVDDAGVTHFSEHPPKNTESTVIKPQTGHSEPVHYDSTGQLSSAPQPTAATPINDQAAQQRQAAADEARAKKNPERCAAARKNMETLQNFGRVKVKDKEGDGFHYLTPDEQQERSKSTQQVIDESC